jgi:hypothetical protein
MYPNSALSVGQLVLIAVVAVVCLAVWIGSVFIAARPPRQVRDAGTAALPQRPVADDEPVRKAA